MLPITVKLLSWPPVSSTIISSVCSWDKHYLFKLKWSSWLACLPPILTLRVMILIWRIKKNGVTAVQTTVRAHLLHWTATSTSTLSQKYFIFPFFITVICHIRFLFGYVFRGFFVLCLHLLFLFSSLGLIFDSEVNTEGVKRNRKQQVLMLMAWPSQWFQHCPGQREAQAQLSPSENVQGSIPTLVNEWLSGWLSVHAEIVFSLDFWGTAEPLKPGFSSFNTVFLPCSVQEGHQNSVRLRNQFHAALSGACSTADPRSPTMQLHGVPTRQLLKSCSSAPQHIGQNPKPSNKPPGKIRKSENKR